MPIYMQIEGIAGVVTAKGHEKWIEVGSFQWGVGRGISSPVGRGANRESNAPSISEVVVTKLLDETSPLIFTEACIGESKKTTFDFVRTDKDKLEVFMQYVLTDCLISGYSLSSGGDRPNESISINFTKIEMSYTGSDSKHAQKGGVRAGYDISQGTKV